MSASLIGNTVSYTSSVGADRGQKVNSFTKKQRDEAIKGIDTTTADSTT